MPPLPATTLRGALQVLGQHDDAWLARVDEQLGQELSDTAVRYPMLSLFGWLDGDVLELVKQALERATDQLPSLRGLVRREVVFAVHTSLVAMAFFESAREVVEAFAVDEPRLPDADEWHQEDNSFVSYLYTDEVPTPSAKRSPVHHLRTIEEWAASRGERLRRTLHNTTWRDVDGLLEPAFAREVVSRYEKRYREAGIPEFVLWTSSNRAEFVRARTALSALERDVPADDVFGDSIYVTPHYRLAEAGPSAKLASDDWWSGVVLRHDLDRLLAGHFTSVEALRIPVLVIGEPGSGKSTLARALAARLPRGGITTVNVPLSASYLGMPLLEQIDQALHRRAGERVGWTDLVQRSADQFRVVVLDGLDEMPSASRSHRAYLDEVVDFQRSQAALGHPVAVVVTCRTSFVDQLVVPADTPVVRLAAFDDAQVGRWVEAWNRTNTDEWRRPLTVDAVLAHPEPARNPWALSLLTELLTDPARPLPSGPITVAEVHRLYLERQTDTGHWSGVSALCLFNRAPRTTSEAELRADLLALHYDAADEVRHVLRDLQVRPATFADHQIAVYLMELLHRTAVSTRNGVEDDKLLFALLSHRLFAHRPSTLTVIAQLAQEAGAEQRRAVTLALGNLILGHRSPRSADLYPEYLPTANDAIRSRAMYSANLVLLRLFVHPANEDMESGLWRGLRDLWALGLDAESLLALQSLVDLDGDRPARRGTTEQVDQVHDFEIVHRVEGDQTQSVHEVTWSSDGRLLTTRAGYHVTCWSVAEDPRPQPIGDIGDVARVAWHPTQPLAAAVSGGLFPVRTKRNGYRLVLTGFEADTTRVLGVIDGGTRLGWSPDGETLAILTASELSTMNVATGARQDVFLFGIPGRTRAGLSLNPRWSRDGKHIWAAAEGDVHRFTPATREHRSHRLGLTTVDVLVGEGPAALAAVVSHNTTDIEIHLLDADMAPVVLQGHLKHVVCAQFSPDGHYLASMSLDNTVRLWRRRDWQCVAVLPRGDVSAHSGLAFHPTKPLLAIADGRFVDVVRLNYQVLGGTSAAESSRLYANAKVVLVGDSGVGKSGLGLVLSGQPFVPTDSTHGRNVWTFEKSYATTPSGDVQTRETLLWDLAGQPGYRMVHQLHLNEVAVALVVFDARSETDPFAGVQYWSRALAQARRLDGAAAVRLRAYLVAARSDRGGTAASTARIEQAVRDFGFDGYVETSAKEGWGVEELIRTVREAVDWEAVPAVTSTALFQAIKDFVLEEKRQGRILTTVDDLLHSFRRTSRDDTPVEELADGFTACLGRLESVGVVRRMAFGDYVLLRPELLDAYASSLVQAAKDEPDGLGFVSEADALAGRFRMPKEERLTNLQQERILLITVVEELLGREIALKEVTDREVDLIFPSQFTRERPDAPDLPGRDVVCTFDGPLYSIYSTLAVRLSHSRLFQRGPMYHNSASYQAKAGGTCGIAIREIAEGTGELVLFYDEQAPLIVRRQFEAYVVEHLSQRAIAVDMRRIRRCKPCDHVVDDEVVQRRLGRGLTTVVCQICEKPVPIVDEEQVDVRPAVAEMNSHANAQRDQDVATTTLKGKREAEDYDVFLCHNVKDKQRVLEIARALESRGILPWLDVDAIQPGSRWQEEMAKGIEKCRSAAVLIGPAGFGRWHDNEMHLINVWSTRDTRRRIIPVILAGTDGEIELPGFLPVRSTIDMRMADPDPLDQLVWGITGEQPRWG